MKPKYHKYKSFEEMFGPPLYDPIEESRRLDRIHELLDQCEKVKKAERLKFIEDRWNLPGKQIITNKVNIFGLTKHKQND